MAVQTSITNQGINTVPYSDIPLGAPFVRASDQKRLYKASTSQALDIEAEATVSISATESVFWAAADGTVAFTRIAAPPAT